MINRRARNRDNGKITDSLPILCVALSFQRQFLKFGRVARRIHDTRSTFPQLIDMSFRPRGVDHDFFTERPDEAVEASEDVIVQ